MVALALTLAALGAAAEAAAPPAKANILYLVADDMCARQRRRIFRMLLRASSDGRLVWSRCSLCSGSGWRWSQSPPGADSRLPAGAPTSAATATPS